MSDPDPRVKQAAAPAPADPQALMRDIADELGDHLACAEADGLRQGLEASQAAESAQRRFGDPARVARQLFMLNGGVWMMVTKFMWLIMLLFVAALIAVVWFSHRQSAAMRTQLEQMNQRLESLQLENATGTLVIRAVRRENQEPVAGLKVTVVPQSLRGRNPFSNPDASPLPSKTFTTNAKGQVRLEPLDLGQYNFWVPAGLDDKSNPVLNFAPDWFINCSGTARITEPDQVEEAVLDLTPPNMAPGLVAWPEDKEWNESETVFVSMSFELREGEFYRQVKYAIRDTILPDMLPEGPWTKIYVTYGFPEWLNRRSQQPVRAPITYFAVLEKTDDSRLLLRPTTREPKSGPRP